MATLSISNALLTGSFVRRELIGRGLPAWFLTTQFAYIPEKHRNDAAALLQPYLPKDKQELASQAIKEQDIWLYVPSRSPWRAIRDMQLAVEQLRPMDWARSDFDIDFLVLQYEFLLGAVNSRKITVDNRLARSIADWLINALYSLESLRLALEQSAKRTPPTTGDPRVRLAVSYADLYMQMHLLGAIHRIRAGWDKITTNLLPAAFGLANPPDKLSSRISWLDTQLKKRLTSEQQSWWRAEKNILESIAKDKGLRDIRDQDLHKVTRWAREVFQDEGERGIDLDAILNIVIEENYRAQDGLVVILALLLS